MKFFRLSLYCWLALLLSATGVSAQTTQPSLPPDVVKSLPDAEFSGKGKLTFFGLEIYEASLWVAPNFKSTDFEKHHLALELHYLRNFTAADIAKRSLDEMQRIEPVPAQKADVWLKTLGEAFPSVKKGERIVGVHKPGVGMSFWHNGKPTADIKDADFSRRFFAIWLSPKTSEPKLRLMLIGNKS